MKMEEKKRPLMRNKISFVDGEKMFCDFCEGMRFSDLSERYKYKASTIFDFAKRKRWNERRDEIKKNVVRSVDEELRIAKANEAKIGVLIKTLNSRRMVREFKVYKKTKKLPSFVGTNTQQYMANLDLAKRLIEGDVEKIQIDANVNGSMKVVTPDQIGKLLELYCHIKGVPVAT